MRVQNVDDEVILQTGGAAAVIDPTTTAGPDAERVSVVQTGGSLPQHFGEEGAQTAALEAPVEWLWRRVSLRVSG